MGGVKGRAADEVAMALGDETPSKAIASAKILGSKTVGNNLSSAKGREYEASSSLWGGLSLAPLPSQINTLVRALQEISSICSLSSNLVLLRDLARSQRLMGDR